MRAATSSAGMAQIENTITARTMKPDSSATNESQAWTASSGDRAPDNQETAGANRRRVMRMTIASDAALAMIHAAASDRIWFPSTCR